MGPRRLGTTDSPWSAKGEVPLVSNDRIGRGGDYQGGNLGSGRASSKYLISDGRMADRVEELRRDRPEVLRGAGTDEALRQIGGVRGPDSPLTVYRATSGDSINHGDWVFLSEGQADRWARASMSKRPKKGFKVVKARVKAKQVGYTGKNLEFVMV